MANILSRQGSARMTFVLERPQDAEALELIDAALSLVSPYLRSIAEGDCIEILEHIESHPGFDPRIGAFARDRIRRLSNGTEKRSSPEAVEADR